MSRPKPLCMAVPNEPNPPVNCIRPVDHQGSHVARGVGAIICIWDDEAAWYNKLGVWFDYHDGKEEVIGE